MEDVLARLDALEKRVSALEPKPRLPLNDGKPPRGGDLVKYRGGMYYYDPAGYLYLKREHIGKSDLAVLTLRGRTIAGMDVLERYVSPRELMYRTPMTVDTEELVAAFKAL